MAATADRTLSLDLSPSDRVAVIAGGGELPRELVRGLTEAGHPPFVIIVGGEDRTGLTDGDHTVLELEEYGRLLPVLRAARATHVVMAGSVSRRPRLRAIRFSVGLLKLLPGIVWGLGRGDDALLRVVVRHIEASGIRVLGSHQILPDLLAGKGPLTRARPAAAMDAGIAAGFAAARAIGALDIGQAAVAVGRRVVALEGVEGTAAMLARVRDLRASGRITMTGGVLVKCAKPGQELRADLPTIGPDTVAEVHDAGLSGIAVEAGRAIVLRQADVIESADRLGLFVVGIDGTTP
ncbi:UDP-2,3-diacylglucosamine diphosphatase LpxI [Aquibium sp. ELW1220]|uniref:LpxI family protein n=1 Tax=Aquibium sp. ELW1220 TaxID=2976766 RepID=UPI0025B159A0|nr:UDP-2,3-diacylglucosamine diphosphatase LpxI [Aquibium sp. ELW1220]MDN2581555.1 UDP-2,3-diacylglucosamine diphosphatase LpxI [Aquibium sp. ELW1220]